MTAIKKDICIVGGGPAGLTTALYLAKFGLASTVIDKSTFPRDKICGDAFSGKVSWTLRNLDAQFETEVHQQNFQLASWGVKFYGTKNNELNVPFKLNYDTKEDKAPGFIAKRKDFDFFLYQKASKNPLIEILENINVNEFSRNENSINIASKNKTIEIETKILVAADGPYSKIAKELMDFHITDDFNCLGLRAYYNNVADLDKDGFIELHFLEELLPGYFWIFPLPNGGANVGAGIRTDLMRHKKINLKKAFLKIVDEHPIISKRFKNAQFVSDIKFHGLPLGGKLRKISSNNLILTGDAAGLVDPFTGEGIGNAMISGKIAAETIEKAFKTNDFSNNTLKKYDQEIYRRLGSELSLSKKMQELTKYPWLFNFVINKARRSKELRETISCMFENVDIRAKLKNPLFYLKILFS